MEDHVQQIFDLLEEKNNCLRSFHDHNAAELIKLKAGNFENLENFYKTREDILVLIRKIDELVEVENRNGQYHLQTSHAEKEKLSQLLKNKDTLAKLILSQDLQIISLIEKEKSQVIKDLKANKMSQKILSASGSGKLTPQIDEKY